MNVFDAIERFVNNPLNDQAACLLMAAIILGLGLSTYWPSKKKRRSAPKQQPYSYRNDPYRGAMYPVDPTLSRPVRSTLIIPEFNSIKDVQVTTISVRGGPGCNQAGYVATAAGRAGQAESNWSCDKAFAEQQAKDFYKHGLLDR